MAPDNFPDLLFLQDIMKYALCLCDTAPRFLDKKYKYGDKKRKNKSRK